MFRARLFSPLHATARNLLTASALSLVLGFAPVSAFAKDKEKEKAAEVQVPADSQQILKLLDLFGDVFEKVRQEYVEVPSDEKLIESAINGMLTNLDPHSSYLDKKAFTDMQVQTRGEFGGLGIEVTMKDGLVYVVSPIDDTPAFKSGIKAGDYISHIDGESVMGMDINEAVKRMRGKPGSKIMLTVVRENEKEPLDISIVRDVIHIQSVRSRVEGDEQKDVLYIRITNFSEQTAKGVKDQVKEKLEKLGGKAKGAVIDLRNNPGGLLNQAIAVADMFLDKGEIVSTRGRKPEDTKRFNATSGDLLAGLPIAVLINGGSASASEIVAGALQDHRRAIIVGTKSFGKGSVQTVIPLPGDAAIRLTTSRYYTPSGRSIQATGIEPDITVEQGTVEYEKNGRRTTEATLKGHLNNGLDAKKPEAHDDEEGAEAPKDTPKKDDKKPVEKDKDGKPIAKKDESQYSTDYQLARAIDMLRGISIFNQSKISDEAIKQALSQ